MNELSEEVEVTIPMQTMAASQNDREIKALREESVFSPAELVESLVTNHIERNLEFMLNNAATKGHPASKKSNYYLSVSPRHF